MRFADALLATIASSGVVAYSATGRTFAVNHFYGKGPLVEGRMDPIVDPGTASGHVHSVQGGNNFALTMTDGQAQASTCTSSRVKNDKSNYWTPKLYFQFENGSFVDVPMFYMNVYYFFEATTDKITAFEPGHRMVVGSPSLRTPPASGGTPVLDLADGVPAPVSWTCPRSNTNAPLYPVGSDGLHGAGIQNPNNAGSGAGFPDQNCDGYASPLRADIHFPSCYNPAEGLDAYKTNMQFPTHGNCPAGWEHKPHLFYEVYWNTPPFAQYWTPGQGKQPFVLSNGDPTGYSLHADFISGWDVPTLQQIIDNCDAGDAGMDKCPGLIGGLNDPSTSCNIPSAINEPITGVMDKLPGNNPLGAWGVPVSPPSTPATSAAAPVGPTSVEGGSTSAKAAPIPTDPVTSSGGSGGAGGGSTPVSIPVASTSSPGGVIQTVSVEPLPGTTSVSAALPTAPAGGDSTTLVTSYLSQTTILWTTVTADGPAPSPTGAESPVAAGWSYHGCFSDNVHGDRVLSGITFANVGQHAVTNTKCVAYCENAGFSMAGTEYGGQCFCGNELVGSNSLSENVCDMPCEGDSTQTCGGSVALSVYSTSSKSKRSSHAHRHLNKHARHASH